MMEKELISISKSKLFRDLIKMGWGRKEADAILEVCILSEIIEMFE